MFALLTRRRDTPTDTANNPPSPAEKTDETPLMRFLTHGGAEVHVSDGYGFPVRCLGCDYRRTSSSDTYARDYANDHATACRAMPKPTAA